MAPQRSLSSHPGSGTSTAVYGRRLLLARLVWTALALLAVSLLAASVVPRLNQLRVVTPHALASLGQLRPADAVMLAQLGLSPSWYAAYLVSFEVVTGVVFVACGATIVVRKSDDWMTLFVSLVLTLFGAVGMPPVLALPAAYPVAEIPVFVLRGLTWGGLIMLTYIFPDGRFVPRGARWFPVVWVVYILAGLLMPALRPTAGPLVVTTWSDIVVNSWIMGCLGAGALAQVYRYRRVAGPVEQQQTKWIVFGIAVAALVAVTAFTIATVLPVLLGASGFQHAAYVVGAIPAVLVAVLLLPVTITISVLRYRLWDVDPLINRALVYGTLSITLALVYFASVLTLQQLLRAVVSQTSQFAVVASTLTMAALFQPMRRRIQDFIDRRFYRRKYDAVRTLQAFSVHLRDEVDLPTLTDDLLAIVHDTMQPTHVSLWLRYGPATSPDIHR